MHICKKKLYLCTKNRARKEYNCHALSTHMEWWNGKMVSALRANGGMIEWEKLAGNGIALKRKKKGMGDMSRHGIALERKKHEIGRNERATALP